MAHVPQPAHPRGSWWRALVAADDFAGRLEDCFLVAAHAIITVIVFIAVLVRYIGGNPLTWDQELIVILFTWLMFIGMSAALRRRMHIRIDLLGHLLRQPKLRFLAWIGVLLGFLAIISLLWSAWVNLVDVLGALTPMLELSQGWLDGALPVGLALFLLHMCRLLAEHGPVELFAGELESIEREADQRPSTPEQGPPT